MSLLLLAAEYKLDLMSVFKGSPFIYSILLALSMLSVSVWIYSLITLKPSKLMPTDFIRDLRSQLMEKKYDVAFVNCQTKGILFGNIIAAGIKSRRHGFHHMREAMEAEGKRCGITLWQRISLLNEIVVIAPMLGLLGTVLGLFLAFYDMNRTDETLTTIFDGLGLAIGTTVVGLMVAIFAMIFYTTLKFRVIKILNMLENHAYAFANLIEPDV